MDNTPGQTHSSFTIHPRGDATFHTQPFGPDTLGSIRLGPFGNTCTIQSTNPEDLLQLAATLVDCADEMTLSALKATAETS